MIPPAAIHRRLVLVLLVMAAMLAVPAVAGAVVDTTVTPSSAPAIWTDKADYNPGATVTLYSAGWAPGEAVHLVVNDSDGQTWSFADDVVASEAGELTDQVTLPAWFVAQYSVTATGDSGATATTSFTDGNLTFQPATADTTQPTASYSVSWTRYNDTVCTTIQQSGTGTATYSPGSPQWTVTGNEPGVGNGDSAKPTGVTAPTGFAFTYWSDSATSSTPVTGAALCRVGSQPAALFAHFRPTIISTSTAVTTSGSPSTYGGQVTFTATVTPASGPAATGTVAFTDGATTLCAAATLNASGKATCQTSSLSAAASPHTITASYSGSSSLSTSSGTVQQAVGKATLTVTAKDAAKTYGDTNPAFSAVITGFVNGDSASAVSGAASCTTGAPVTSGAGTYPITCTQGTLTAANYTFSFANGTLTIGPRPLAVTAPSPSRLYGDANPALIAALSGFVNGDTATSAVSGAASCSTAATTASSVGTYTVICTAGTLASANYSFGPFVPGVLSVTKAPLTVKADDQTKVYGDDNPALTGKVTGTRNGDNLLDTYTTAADAKSGVGSYAISAHIAAGPGADLGNYQVQLVDGTLSVTKAPLTVKADDQTKVYGDDNPALTGKVTGTRNGDNLLDSYTTGANAASGVGSYAINAHLAAGQGADLANYDANLVNGTMTVTKAPLAVKADDQTKVYGDDNPALTGKVVGTRNGDNLLDSYTTAADARSAVGTYAINAHVAAGTGADLANYNVNLVNGTMTVTKAPLAVKADDQSKVYGDANPALTGKVTGIKNGDNLLDTYTTAADAKSGVGTYAINAHVAAGAGADLANYDINLVSGTMTVTKAPLTVQADDQTKVYGDDNPALTGKVTGTRNGDNLLDTYTTAADATSGVGSYAIDAQVAAGQGADLGNYQVQLVDGTLSVTKAPLTVQADDQTKVYGDDNPALTGKVTGVKNGDNLIDSYTTAADATSGVGSYAINAHVAAGTGADLANYNVNLVDGTLSVTKAPLMVTADDQSKTYGDANPVLTGKVTGVKNGDNLLDSYTTGANAASGAGSYAISAHIAAGPGADLGNYQVQLIDGTLTITKAPLTVKADDQAKTYGDTNPALTGKVTGTKNGDHLIDSYTTAADATSGVGSYAINAHVAAGTGADLANYDINLVSGTMTVTKAPLTVKAADQTKTYGDTNPALTGKVTGAKNGDHLIDSYTTAADATSAVGSYAINAHVAAGTGADLANYDINLVNGTMTVTKAPLTVKAADQTKTYGDANPVFTGTITGTKNSDNLIDSYTTSAGAASGVGTYAINAQLAAGTGADLANYNVNLVDGTLTVTKAPVTVKADDKTKTYGDANPALTGKVTGTKNGDNLVDTYTTTPDATTGVGSYAVNAHLAAGPGASLANYDVSLVDGTLTIVKAPLTITADDKSKVLNAANPAFTGTVAGLKNGDGITAVYGTSATTGSPVGTYAIVATAIDSSPSRLGNYTVTLVNGALTVGYATGNCAGSAGRTVLQPVNADGTSVFKKGSTVPVKFRVCDANGASIGSAGVVTGTPAAPVLVSKSTGVGGVDESVYSTTPDTSFRWDPSAQQWIYNQATSNLTSGVAYTYKIPLNDGTWITYRFTTK
jgi:MBG domain-containing protein/Big-like domain-containing protein